MYSGGINRNTVWARKASDLARVTAQPLVVEPVNSQLMKVTGYTAIDAANKRYLYTVRAAQVGPASGYVAAQTGNSLEEQALSVSELSNAGSFVSYGVLKSAIPAGFAPKAIPIGTYVLCVPHRLTDGALRWLIVNTQAIDGTCAGGLTADYDFGLLLQPTDEDLEAGTLDAPEAEYDWGGITYDDYGQFYDDLNALDQQTFATPVAATTDYGTY